MVYVMAFVLGILLMLIVAMVLLFIEMEQSRQLVGELEKALENYRDPLMERMRTVESRMSKFGDRHAAKFDALDTITRDHDNRLALMRSVWRKDIDEVAAEFNRHEISTTAHRPQKARKKNGTRHVGLGSRAKTARPKA